MINLAHNNIDIPVIVAAKAAASDLKQGISSFKQYADTAQYKGSDYSNAVRVERGITLAEAHKIAESDPNIDYFCYIKGGCMVLESCAEHAKNDPLRLISYSTFVMDGTREVKNDYARIFSHGDTVFFSDKDGKKWLGSAPGLADTYIRNK